MYELFYHLEKRPFVLTPDPDYFYQSKSCQKALNLLELGLTNKLSLNIVLGDVGIGKTSIIQHFVSQLPHEFIAGVVAMHEEQSTEKLLREALITLGVVDYSNDKRDVRGQWRKFVNGKLGDNRKRVLVIDDAEHLSFEALNTLLAFIKHRPYGQKNIHIVLVGHCKLEEKYKDSYLQSFIHSAGLSYRVQPLNHQETDEYIQYRLKTAGARKTRLMDYLALDAIYQYSEGVPRIINFLCDTAFGYGYAERKSRIDKFLVDKSAFKLKRSLGLEISGSKNVVHQESRDDRLSANAGIEVPLKHNDLDARPKVLNQGGPTSSTVDETAEQSGVKVEVVAHHDQPDFDRPPLDGTWVIEKPRINRSHRAATAIACTFLLGAGIVFYLLPDHRSDPSVAESAAISEGSEEIFISQDKAELLAENSSQLEMPLPREETSGNNWQDDKEATGEQSDFSAVIPKIGDLAERARDSVNKPLTEDPLDSVAGNLHKSDNRLDEGKKHNGLPPTTVSQQNVEGSQERPPQLSGELTTNKRQRLIELANQQMAARKLTSPIHDNAYATYRQLLEMSPKDEQALTGLQRVADSYLDIAQRQLANKNYQKSRDLVYKGLKVIPGDKRLLNLKKQADLKQRAATKQQQAKAINVLLARAEKQLDELKLTWPKGDNAYETYQKVVSTDKNNSRAVQGLETIVRQYMDITLKAESRGDLASALDYSEQALLVDPNHVHFKRKQQEILAALEAINIKKARIDDLLTLAGRQIQNRQVIRPEGENAVESYKQVLRIDPENQQASMGLETLAQRYEMLIRRKISKGDRKQASIMVEEGISKFLDPVRFNELRTLLRRQEREPMGSDTQRRNQAQGPAAEKPKSQRRIRSFGTF